MSEYNDNKYTILTRILNVNYDKLLDIIYKLCVSIDSVQLVQEM